MSFPALEFAVANPLDVVDYLLYSAENEDETQPLTRSQLQKLLYYVQGWALALHGGPIFDVPVEAWENGPAIREVHHALMACGDGPVDRDDCEEGDASRLTEEERGVVDSVWEAYKGYSAIHLRKMVREEAPWVDARAGLDPDERGAKAIPLDAMEVFFKAMAAE